MGGLGSGQWFRWDTRTTLEAVRCLDVRWLSRQGLLAGRSCVVTWHRGEQQAGSIGVTMRAGRVVLEYRYCPPDSEQWEPVRQGITLDWTPCHYGGQRPWFRCPGCGRRVAVLCGRGKHFRCRHCARLPYASQGETRLARLQRKAQKLEARVAGSVTKPKGMHWRTWERLYEQLIEVEHAQDAVITARWMQLRHSWDRSIRRLGTEKT